ncbi:MULTISPECIES: transcriptional regulator [Pseudomonas]|jgi:predicted transcriptional regulator YheO|uniref:PAS domain-containing protein n=2 Tax=Pseudomonas TaxID=286 RepID=A0A7Y8K939_9PSED|nr:MULTISPECIES: PAS domain-containing protein [Pseudomonas]MDP9028860.1 PAS domain-containing protein [Pseudomonadota bacterium]AUO23365.1 DNA-binding protein [Pseudomonas sp. NC02]EJF73897.1 putative DNA-binding protein [Pseudomonas sp. Ag1]MBT1265595.1 PAS domain-containing protein [Pseudomonas sp. VS38]MCS3421297.1 putative transcriptional regulator YheO [Pseudomonas sp. BIGb0558]|eukprot:gene12764-14975_t
MKKHTPEQAALISQLEQIAEGLSKTFSPFCEVVLHDLRDPQHAIMAIHNNLSGRQPGDPATELGLARIADPEYPQVIANYQNQFADGRQVKSTSIGIKDSTGKYVAALCMNVDLSLFRGLQGMLEQFGSVSGDRPAESLDPSGADAIRARIDQFAARLATTPRALKAADRRLLMQELKEAGVMDIRRAMETVASHLGVSRAAVYTYAK